MSVTITITGSDAAEAVKELSSLAKSVVPATGQIAQVSVESPVVTAPKPVAEKPKPAATEPKPQPVAEKPKPAPAPAPAPEPVAEKPKPAGKTELPKDGTEREKAAIAFMKAAIDAPEHSATLLASYPVEDQYTLLRQFGIELMQTSRKPEFDKANADFGIKALKDISTDPAKMAVHFKTLAGLLAV